MHSNSPGMNPESTEFAGCGSEPGRLFVCRTILTIVTDIRVLLVENDHTFGEVTQENLAQDERITVRRASRAARGSKSWRPRISTAS